MQRSGSERVALAGLLRPEAFGQGGDAPYDILLREWIAFHRLAGVSRFYLCRCTANPLDAPRDDSVVGCVLEPLVGAGILVLDTCQGAGVHDHTHDGAMAKEDETARYVSYCIGRCRDEPLWVAPADAPCTYLVPAATATTAIATERPLIGDALAKLAAHDARPNRTCGAVSVPVHHRDGVPPIYSILVGHAIRENSHTTARHDTVPQGAEGDHEEVVAHRVIVRSESVSIMTTTAEPVFEAADRGHAPMNPCVARDGTSSGGDLLVFYNHRRARHARDGPHEPKEPVHAAYTATRWPAILARAWPEGDARASSAGSLAEGMDRLGLMSPELGTLGEMARFALDAVAARSLCLTPLPKAAAKREMGSAPADDNALSSTQKSMERRWGASVRTLVAGQPRVCIVMHIGYAAEWPFYRQHLLNVVRAQIAFDLYVTVTEGQQSPSLDADLRAFGAMGSHTGVGSTGRDTNGTQGHARAERYIDAAPHHFTPGQEEEEEEHAMQSAGVLSGQTDNHTAIIRVPNRGLDGGAWLLAMRAAMRHASAIGTPYDVVLKMHTKRPHLYGPEWRRELIEAIVGSPERVADCIATLLTDPSVGMLCAQDWIISEEPRQCVFDMAVRMGMDAARPHEMTEPLAFCGGTMFWARFDALADPLERCLFDALAASLTPGYPRGIDSDGHFIERALCVMVRRAHLTIKGVERLRPPLAMGLGETPALFDPSLAHLLGVTVPVAGDASTESISTDAARTHHPIRSLIRFAVERWIHARSGHTQTCTATACPWGLSLVPPKYAPLSFSPPPQTARLVFFHQIAPPPRNNWGNARRESAGFLFCCAFSLSFSPVGRETQRPPPLFFLHFCLYPIEEEMDVPAPVAESWPLDATCTHSVYTHKRT